MADLGQFGKPKGPLGKFFGWMMDRYNKLEHVETIKSLDLQPDDQVLEIGYGTGQAMNLSALTIQLLCLKWHHGKTIIGLIEESLNFMWGMQEV